VAHLNEREPAQKVCVVNPEGSIVLLPLPAQLGVQSSGPLVALVAPVAAPLLLPPRVPDFQQPQERSFPLGAPFAELGPLGLLLVLLIAIRGTEKVRGVLWGEEIRQREREGGIGQKDWTIDSNAVMAATRGRGLDEEEDGTHL